MTGENGTDISPPNTLDGECLYAILMELRAIRALLADEPGPIVVNNEIPVPQAGEEVAVPGLLGRIFRERKGR